MGPLCPARHKSEGGGGEERPGSELCSERAGSSSQTHRVHGQDAGQLQLGGGRPRAGWVLAPSRPPGRARMISEEPESISHPPEPSTAPGRKPRCVTLDPELTGPRRVSRCFCPQSPGPGRRDTSSNPSWKESPAHLASGFPQISLNQTSSQPKTSGHTGGRSTVSESRWTPAKTKQLDQACRLCSHEGHSPRCRPVLYANPEAGKQAEEKTPQTDQEL